MRIWIEVHYPEEAEKLLRDTDDEDGNPAPAPNDALLQKQIKSWVKADMQIIDPNWIAKMAMAHDTTYRRVYKELMRHGVNRHQDFPVDPWD
jgi:hypothetical protein